MPPRVALWKHAPVTSGAPNVDPAAVGRRRVAWLALAVLEAAAGIGWGVLSLLLQQRLTAHLVSGHDLDPISRRLAAGSSGATAWPGYAAAVLFAAAAVRVRLGRPEPPVGRPRRGTWTAAEMRARLRSEYRWVRRCSRIVAAVAAVDAGRTLVYLVAALRGVTVARSSLGATAAEAGGLILAALALQTWLHGFRLQLERWGAL